MNTRGPAPEPPAAENPESGSGAPASFFLVIPCFRESGRIEPFLRELCGLIQARALPCRVLVVDDGSGESEQAGLSGLIATIRGQYDFLLPLLGLPENLGKGGAIYAGWQSQGTEDWLAFADADGSTSGTEICRLMSLIAARPKTLDAVIASRILMLGKRVERSAVRHYTGRIYATISSLMTGLSIYDSQCGCKFVRKAAFQKVLPLLEEKRFGFDMELLSLLLLHGAQIEEVPVNWTDTPGSKVHLLRDSVDMFRGLLRLRHKLRRLAATPGATT